MQVLDKCFNCGKPMIQEGMGKFIDGSWVDDWRVRQTEAGGKWVCSLQCYWEVLGKYGWSFTEDCDTID